MCSWPVLKTNCGGRHAEGGHDLFFGRLWHLVVPPPGRLPRASPRCAMASPEGVLHMTTELSGSDARICFQEHRKQGCFRLQAHMDVLVAGPENKLWRQARGRWPRPILSSGSDTSTCPHPRAFARD